MQDEIEQVVDAPMTLNRVAQRMMTMHDVRVSPAVALTGDKAGGLELGHDPLHRTLRDPDPVRDVAETDLRILGEAEENVGVIGQEGPVKNAIGHRAELRRSEFEETRHVQNATDVKRMMRAKASGGQGPGCSTRHR